MTKSLETLKEFRDAITDTVSSIDTAEQTIKRLLKERDRQVLSRNSHLVIN